MIWPGRRWIGASAAFASCVLTRKASGRPETLCIDREVAIGGSRAGSIALGAVTNRIEPGAETGPRHHGHLESVIRGEAPLRWGERLEFITRASPGDFMLVRPCLPRQELNASATKELHCAFVRTGARELGYEP